MANTSMDYEEDVSSGSDADDYPLVSNCYNECNSLSQSIASYRGNKKKQQETHSKRKPQRLFQDKSYADDCTTQTNDNFNECNHKPQIIPSKIGYKRRYKETNSESGPKLLLEAGCKIWIKFIVRRDILLLLFTLLLIICLLYFLFVPQTQIQDLESMMKKIREKYDGQSEETWIKVINGLQNVMDGDPAAPATFLVMYHENANLVQELTNDIAIIAAKALDAVNSSVLDISQKDIQGNKNISEDHGWLMKLYKTKINEHRHLIIKDVQDIQASTALAFHYFCDSENPVVSKAVYLFTLKLKNKLQNLNKKALSKHAEEELDALWRGKLQEDFIMPLISRLTGWVLYLK